MNPSPSLRNLRRRTLLKRATATALALPGAAYVPPALAALPNARTISLRHTHTGESLSLVYALGSDYVQASLARANQFLRDHYSGAIGTIDPALFEQLFALTRALGRDGAFEVVSGFRSAQTNEALRRRGGGGVASQSLHLLGRAIDVRLPGVPLSDLRTAALDARAGGVGYYPGSNFVHLDTGRFRHW